MPTIDKTLNPFHGHLNTSHIANATSLDPSAYMSTGISCRVRYQRADMHLKGLQGGGHSRNGRVNRPISTIHIFK